MTSLSWPSSATMWAIIMASSTALRYVKTCSFSANFWAMANAMEHYQEALDRFNLNGLEDIPAGIMSAGQKRRLGLARLVLIRRPVWFLDEPSVSLDVQSVKILADVVTNHIKNGGLAIAATHVPLGLDFKDELVMGR